jgi:hypothetical protein
MATRVVLVLLSELFGDIAPLSVSEGLLAMPGAAYELTQGGWLIVKRLSPAAMASGSKKEGRTSS